jgi:hypothetical protein
MFNILQISSSPSLIVPLSNMITVVFSQSHSRYVSLADHADSNFQSKLVVSNGTLKVLVRDCRTSSEDNIILGRTMYRHTVFRYMTPDIQPIQPIQHIHL